MTIKNSLRPLEPPPGGLKNLRTQLDKLEPKKKWQLSNWNFWHITVAISASLAILLLMTFPVDQSELRQRVQLYSKYLKQHSNNWSASPNQQTLLRVPTANKSVAFYWVE